LHTNPEAFLNVSVVAIPAGIQVHRIFEVMNVDTLVAMHESSPVAIASLPAVPAANGSANADAA
jgi:hypothetical protein